MSMYPDVRVSGLSCQAAGHEHRPASHDAFQASGGRHRPNMRPQRGSIEQPGNLRYPAARAGSAGELTAASISFLMLDSLARICGSWSNYPVTEYAGYRTRAIAAGVGLPSRDCRVRELSGAATRGRIERFTCPGGSPRTGTRYAARSRRSSSR